MKHDVWRHKQFLARLLKLSLNEVGEIELERVEAVLSSLANVFNYLEHKKLLKDYYVRIEDALRKEEVRIRYVGNIRSDQIEALKHFFSKRYRRGVRIVTMESPELIAGYRIRIGDDVYDDSILGRLKRLRNPQYYR